MHGKLVPSRGSHNTMADIETGTLLAGEGYYMDIATQFYEVAETLRLILYNALS